MSLSPELKQHFEQTLASNRVVLFMKGVKSQPQCGFSATVVGVLEEYGVPFHDINVLADPAVRSGIKEFSSWPTIPQIYVDGNFVGGCDIVKEMHGNGELASLLGVKLDEVEPPSIEVTDTARDALMGALADAGSDVRIRLGVSAGYQIQLGLDVPGTADIVVEVNGVGIVLDRGSARRAGGAKLDFVTEGGRSGFSITGIQDPSAVAEMAPATLKQRLDDGAPLRVYDVRTPEERGVACLPFAIHLDTAAAAELEGLPKDTPLVFQCHHGGRSMQAAQRYKSLGFTSVWNLTGGIDAWSLTVDSSIPRY